MALRAPGPGPARTDAFADLVDALRAAQDWVRLADLPHADAKHAAGLLWQVAEVARRHPAEPGSEPTSHRPDLPGRGNALIPGFTINEELPDVSTGTGTFSAAHLGRGAVHGGSVAVIFDEIVGRLVERDGRHARTAYLHVNYRHLTR